MTPAIDRLVSANLIVRKGHGTFEVAHPCVKHAWLQHVQMQRTLVGPIDRRTTSSEEDRAYGRAAATGRHRNAATHVAGDRRW